MIEIGGIVWCHVDGRT